MEKYINNVKIILNECEKHNKTNEIEYEQIKNFLINENISLNDSNIDKIDFELKNYKKLIPDNILEYKIYKKSYNNLQQKETSIIKNKKRCKFTCFLFIIWIYIIFQEFTIIYFSISKEEFSDEIILSRYANIPIEYTFIFYIIILFLFSSYCIPFIYSLSHRYFFSYNRIRFNKKSSTLTLLTFANNLASSLFPIIYIGSLLASETAKNLKIKNEEKKIVDLDIIFNQYFIIPDIKIKYFNLTALIRILILGFWIIMIFLKEIKINNKVIFDFDSDDVKLFTNDNSDSLIDVKKIELNTLTEKNSENENV